VRSRVEIVAAAGAGGGTALVRMQADGQLAVRATGTPGDAGGGATVHLVGAAAGPLGGDEVQVVVRVGAGARLVVRGVAATLALPGRAGGTGQVSTRLEVADGGALDFEPSPLVVCAGARTRTTTIVDLRGTARLHLAEQVVLGRHGEAGGVWTGHLRADRDGLPLLRATQSSAAVDGAPLPGGPAGGPGARVLLTRLVTDATCPAATTAGGATCCPLAAGGVLVTALGRELGRAATDADAALHAAGADSCASVATPS